jgi:predicted phage tail protein
MSRNVYLHGELGEKFGDHWEMSAPTIADAIKLIECQTKGFKKYLIESVDAGLEAAIVIKDREIEEALELNLNMEGDMHIALMPSGSRKGWAKLILAAIIIYLTWGAASGPAATWAAAPASAAVGAPMVMSYTGMLAMSFGLSLAMMGITELTTKTPKHDKAGEGGMFNGPESTIVQGTPVPILYGELLIGGKPISVNFKAGGMSTGGYGGGTWNNSMANFKNGDQDWWNDIDAWGIEVTRV